MLDIMMHPFTAPAWVIVLAILRVLSVVSCLLALRHVRQNLSNQPVANRVLLLGLVLLAVGQAIGAWGMDKPTAPTPTPFAFIANSGAIIVCLGIYLRGVIAIRR